jgi:hypothetical protein
MAFNKNEMIEQLKFEINMVEKGRYYPSVREPQKTPEIFRDTITCLNVGLPDKRYPCSACFLSEFVPPQAKGFKGDLCHKIPLNARGDTVESLKAADDPFRLREAVRGWLKDTVEKLEGETDQK